MSCKNNQIIHIDAVMTGSVPDRSAAVNRHQSSRSSDEISNININTISQCDLTTRESAPRSELSSTTTDEPIVMLLRRKKKRAADKGKEGVRAPLPVSYANLLQDGIESNDRVVRTIPAVAREEVNMNHVGVASNNFDNAGRGSSETYDDAPPASYVSNSDEDTITGRDTSWCGCSWLQKGLWAVLLSQIGIVAGSSLYIYLRLTSFIDTTAADTTPLSSSSAALAENENDNSSNINGNDEDEQEKKNETLLQQWREELKENLSTVSPLVFPVPANTSTICIRPAKKFMYKVFEDAWHTRRSSKSSSTDDDENRRIADGDGPYNFKHRLEIREHCTNGCFGGSSVSGDNVDEVAAASDPKEQEGAQHAAAPMTSALGVVTPRSPSLWSISPRPYIISSNATTSATTTVSPSSTNGLTDFEKEDQKPESQVIPGGWLVWESRLIPLIQNPKTAKMNYNGTDPYTPTLWESSATEISIVPTISFVNGTHILSSSSSSDDADADASTSSSPPSDIFDRVEVASLYSNSDLIANTADPCRDSSLLFDQNAWQELSPTNNIAIRNISIPAGVALFCLRASISVVAAQSLAQEQSIAIVSAEDGSRKSSVTAVKLATNVTVTENCLGGVCGVVPSLHKFYTWHYKTPPGPPPLTLHDKSNIAYEKRKQNLTVLWDGELIDDSSASTSSPIVIALNISLPCNLCQKEAEMVVTPPEEAEWRSIEEWDGYAEQARNFRNGYTLLFDTREFARRVADVLSPPLFLRSPACQKYYMNIRHGYHLSQIDFPADKDFSGKYIILEHTYGTEVWNSRLADAKVETTYTPNQHLLSLNGKILRGLVMRMVQTVHPSLQQLEARAADIAAQGFQFNSITWMFVFSATDPKTVGGPNHSHPDSFDLSIFDILDDNDFTFEQLEAAFHRTDLDSDGLLTAIEVHTALTEEYQAMGVFTIPERNRPLDWFADSDSTSPQTADEGNTDDDDDDDSNRRVCFKWGLPIPSTNATGDDGASSSSGSGLTGGRRRQLFNFTIEIVSEVVPEPEERWIRIPCSEALMCDELDKDTHQSQGEQGFYFVRTHQPAAAENTSVDDNTTQEPTFPRSRAEQRQDEAAMVEEIIATRGVFSTAVLSSSFLGSPFFPSSGISTELTLDTSDRVNMTAIAIAAATTNMVSPKHTTTGSPQPKPTAMTPPRTTKNSKRWVIQGEEEVVFGGAVPPTFSIQGFLNIPPNARLDRMRYDGQAEPELTDDVDVFTNDRNLVETSSPSDLVQTEFPGIIQVEHAEDEVVVNKTEYKYVFDSSKLRHGTEILVDNNPYIQYLWKATLRDFSTASTAAAASFASSASAASSGGKKQQGGEEGAPVITRLSEESRTEILISPILSLDQFRSIRKNKNTTATTAAEEEEERQFFPIQVAALEDGTEECAGYLNFKEWNFENQSWQEVGYNKEQLINFPSAKPPAKPSWVPGHYSSDKFYGGREGSSVHGGGGVGGDGSGGGNDGGDGSGSSTGGSNGGVDGDAGVLLRRRRRVIVARIVSLVGLLVTVSVAVLVSAFMIVRHQQMRNTNNASNGMGGGGGAGGVNNNKLLGGGRPRQRHPMTAAAGTMGIHNSNQQHQHQHQHQQYPGNHQNTATDAFSVQQQHPLFQQQVQAQQPQHLQQHNSQPMVKFQNNNNNNNTNINFQQQHNLNPAQQWPQQPQHQQQQNGKNGGPNQKSQQQDQNQVQNPNQQQQQQQQQLPFVEIAECAVCQKYAAPPRGGSCVPCNSNNNPGGGAGSVEQLQQQQLQLQLQQNIRTTTTRLQEVTQSLAQNARSIDEHEATKTELNTQIYERRNHLAAAAVVINKQQKQQQQQQNKPQSQQQQKMAASSTPQRTTTRGQVQQGAQMEDNGYYSKMMRKRAMPAGTTTPAKTTTGSNKTASSSSIPNHSFGSQQPPPHHLNPPTTEQHHHTGAGDGGSSSISGSSSPRSNKHLSNSDSTHFGGSDGAAAMNNFQSASTSQHITHMQLRSTSTNYGVNTMQMHAHMQQQQQRQHHKSSSPLMEDSDELEMETTNEVTNESSRDDSSGLNEASTTTATHRDDDSDSVLADLLQQLSAIQESLSSLYATKQSLLQEQSQLQMQLQQQQQTQMQQQQSTPLQPPMQQLQTVEQQQHQESRVRRFRVWRSFAEHHAKYHAGRPTQVYVTCSICGPLKSQQAAKTQQQQQQQQQQGHNNQPSPVHLFAVDSLILECGRRHPGQGVVQISSLPQPNPLTTATPSGFVPQPQSSQFQPQQQQFQQPSTNQNQPHLVPTTPFQQLLQQNSSLPTLQHAQQQQHQQQQLPQPAMNTHTYQQLPTF